MAVEGTVAGDGPAASLLPREARHMAGRDTDRF
jgi:hypothetical protein